MRIAMKKLFTFIAMLLCMASAFAGITDPDQVRIVANNPSTPSDGTLTNFFPVPSTGQACMFYFDGTARKPRCPRVISGVTWDSVNSTISFSGSPGPTGPAGSTGLTGPAGANGTNGTNGAPGTTDYLGLTNVPTSFAPAAHTHLATDISDSTAAGRAVLTAPSAASARSTLGVLSTSEVAAAYYPLSGNPSAFLTGITSTQVTAALGFTPYNATNPASYITASALSPYLTSTTAASTYATTTALTSGLAGKFNAPAGTTAQYLRGDGSLATLPATAPFNFSQPTVRTLAVSTSYQALDITKAAIVVPSYACQNATQVLASSACTVQVRMGTGTLTCSTGTIYYTQSLTVSLGVLLTQNSTNPVQINLPIGGSFILCQVAGTFTTTAVEQSAG
jgi:hypothetical protein